MSTATTTTTRNSTRSLLAEVGKSLPNRERIKATKGTSVNIEPTGMLKLTAYIDTYLEGKVFTAKNNLQGKKLVLIFGKESHPLTRTYYVPKLAMIYQNLTLQRDDIEFLYVSMDPTKAEFDRFTKSHPWPCIAYDEHAAIRETLTQVYHTHLKKKHGMCSIVVLDSDHETPLNVDAESNINSTQNETGSDFPWKTSAAANCCAGAAALVLCSIL